MLLSHLRTFHCFAFFPLEPFFFFFCFSLHFFLPPYLVIMLFSFLRLIACKSSLLLCIIIHIFIFFPSLNFQSLLPRLCIQLGSLEKFPEVNCCRLDDTVQRHVPDGPTRHVFASSPVCLSSLMLQFQVTGTALRVMTSEETSNTTRTLTHTPRGRAFLASAAAAAQSTLTPAVFTATLRF